MRDDGYTADSPYSEPYAESLKQKLLSFGGEAVVLRSFGSEAQDILSRGELCIENEPIMSLGLHSQCHSNSSMNFLEKGYLIMTGYALSNDGAWREHSWNRDPVSGRIVETTELRMAYFGFEMDEAEAAQFADVNKIAPDPIYLRGDPSEPFINVVIVDNGENFSMELDEDTGGVEVRFSGQLPTGPNVVRLWIIEREANRFCITASVDMYEVTEVSGETLVRSDHFSRFDPPESVITHAALIEDLNGLANGDFLAINEDSPEFAHLNELALKNYYSD